MNGKREYGDYQTPEFFSSSICRYLKDVRKITPSVIIEPTCGLGSFVKSCLIFDALKIIGIEINREYCDKCSQAIKNRRVHILNADIFNFDLKSFVNEKDQVLIIGNPPWVNNSTLSLLNSDNIPKKQNIKGLKGLDAVTGASNFDICEYIILRMIASLHNTNATIAMLCKTSVARNIFTEMKRNHTKFKTCDIIEFSADRIFGISASACLLIIELSSENISADVCNVYSFDNPNVIKSSFGYVGGSIYCNIGKNITDFSGKCCFEWRQGVKHDCAKIMELSVDGTAFSNGLDETVNIESKYVFPLMKSSMFKYPIVDSFSKYLIVTQKNTRRYFSHRN